MSVIPTGADQHRAWRLGDVPGPEQVRDGVLSVPVPMPGRLRYSLCYLVEADDGVHVVDPGTDAEASWRRLVDALALLGRTPSDVRTVTATHLHGDHLGLARQVSRTTGAPLVLSAREQTAIDTRAHQRSDDDARLARWGVPPARRDELLRALREAGRPEPVVADVLLQDGQRLPWPGRSAVALLTAGHTPGHLCLQLADDGLLMTGDHVLPGVHSGIGLGGPDTDPVAAYLDSLDRVAVLDDHEALPGHGYRFRGLAGRCAELGTHHRRRSQEIAAAHRDAPDATVWQTAAAVSWTGGWEQLRGVMLHSALLQTELHLAHLGVR